VIASAAINFPVAMRRRFRSPGDTSTNRKKCPQISEKHQREGINLRFQNRRESARPHHSIAMAQNVENKIHFMSRLRELAGKGGLPARLRVPLPLKQWPQNLVASKPDIR